MKPAFGPAKARARRLGPEDLVDTSCVIDSLLPVSQARVEGIDLAAWIAGHRPWVRDQSLRYGAVLFRGFAMQGHENFTAAVEQGLGFELMEYKYRSTPRRDVANRIYTATLYPASESIPLHNELSYSRSWPSHILFFSQRPADRGGESTLADSRKVYASVPSAVREKFERKGVLYVRNYGLLDLPWSEVFGTTSREEVETYCRQNGIEVRWGADGSLATRQRCQATIRHPWTDAPVWFNQAHLFHHSALEAEVRRELLACYSPDELPRNACYGDGEPLEDEVLESIRAAYAEHTVALALQKGDVLMLDNRLVAHGRLGYAGERHLFAALTNEPTED